jgi:hypothetical protein
MGNIKKIIELIGSRDTSLTRKLIVITIDN